MAYKKYSRKSLSDCLQIFQQAINDGHDIPSQVLKEVKLQLNQKLEAERSIALVPVRASKLVSGETGIICQKHRTLKKQKSCGALFCVECWDENENIENGK